MLYTNYVDGLARLAIRDAVNVSILSSNMAIKVTTATSTAPSTISSLSSTGFFAVSLSGGTSSNNGSTRHRRLSSATSIMMSVTRAGLYYDSKPLDTDKSSSDITSNPIRLLTTCSSSATTKATVVLPLFSNQSFGTLAATNKRYCY